MKVSRLLLPILLVAGIVQVQGSRLHPELDNVTSTYNTAIAGLYKGAAASIAIFIDDVTSCSRTSVRSMWGL
jgi:hypothetical protein